jgi:hypothetical protein
MPITDITVQSGTVSTCRQLKMLLMMVLMKASCKSRSKTLECRDSTRFRHSKSPGYVAYEWIVHHTISYPRLPRARSGHGKSLAFVHILALETLEEGLRGLRGLRAEHGQAWSSRAWVSMACRPASTWTKAVANTNKENAKYHKIYCKIE